jgi:selenocysteine lyase/cysteine desulfurase
MHEALGTLDGGLIRVSLSFYTEQSELDMLLSALQDIEKL